MQRWQIPLARIQMLVLFLFQRCFGLRYPSRNRAVNRLWIRWNYAIITIKLKLLTYRDIMIFEMSLVNHSFLWRCPNLQQTKLDFFQYAWKQLLKCVSLHWDWSVEHITNLYSVISVYNSRLYFSDEMIQRPICVFESDQASLITFLKIGPQVLFCVLDCYSIDESFADRIWISFWLDEPQPLRDSAHQKIKPCQFRRRTNLLESTRRSMGSYLKSTPVEREIEQFCNLATQASYTLTQLHCWWRLIFSKRLKDLSFYLLHLIWQLPMQLILSSTFLHCGDSLPRMLSILMHISIGSMDLVGFIWLRYPWSYMPSIYDELKLKSCEKYAWLKHLSCSFVDKAPYGEQKKKKCRVNRKTSKAPMIRDSFKYDFVG